MHKYIWCTIHSPRTSAKFTDRYVWPCLYVAETVYQQTVRNNFISFIIHFDFTKFPYFLFHRKLRSSPLGNSIGQKRAGPIGWCSNRAMSVHHFSYGYMHLGGWQDPKIVLFDTAVFVHGVARAERKNATGWGKVSQSEARMLEN